MSTHQINSELQLLLDKGEKTVEIAYAALILKRPVLFGVVVLGINATIWQVYIPIISYTFIHICLHFESVVRERRLSRVEPSK
jgi:hypothetical protein